MYEPMTISRSVAAQIFDRIIMRITGTVFLLSFAPIINGAAIVDENSAFRRKGEAMLSEFKLAIRNVQCSVIFPFTSEYVKGMIKEDVAARKLRTVGARLTGPVDAQLGNQASGVTACINPHERKDVSRAPSKALLELEFSPSAPYVSVNGNTITVECIGAIGGAEAHVVGSYTTFLNGGQFSPSSYEQKAWRHFGQKTFKIERENPITRESEVVTVVERVAEKFCNVLFDMKLRVLQAVKPDDSDFVFSNFAPVPLS